MKKILIGLSFFGASFNTLEWWLRQYGKTICQTEGCKLAMGIVRNEDIMLFLGISTFLILGVLFLFSHKRVFPIIDIILVGVLSVEGYLLGIQLFSLSHFCSFCFITGLVFFAIVFVYLVTYRRFTPVTGIFAFFMVLFITYWVSPAAGSLEKIAMAHYVKGTPKNRWYLFVTKDCPHCKEVLDYCLNQYNGDLELYVCEAERCRLFLKNLGIKEVPALLIEGKGKKEILVGEQCILQDIKKRIQALPQIFFTPPQGVCGIDACQ